MWGACARGMHVVMHVMIEARDATVPLKLRLWFLKDSGHSHCRAYHDARTTKHAKKKLPYLRAAESDVYMYIITHSGTV
jgi:hypothetical protein